MAVCWRADDEPNIECWLGSVVSFRGSGPVLLRNLIFLSFSRVDPEELIVELHYILTSPRKQLKPCGDISNTRYAFKTKTIDMNRYAHISMTLLFSRSVVEQDKYFWEVTYVSYMYWMQIIAKFLFNYFIIHCFWTVWYWKGKHYHCWNISMLIVVWHIQFTPSFNILIIFY